MRGIHKLLLGVACTAGLLTGLVLSAGCSCEGTHWPLAAGTYAGDGWYALEDDDASTALSLTLTLGDRGDPVEIEYTTEDGQSWRVSLAED